MLKYVLKRLLYLVFVFFLISILMFAVYKAVPSDPVYMYTEGRQNEMSPRAFEEYKAQVRIMLGLDRPVYVQYLRWISNMLTGDFGRSSVHRMEVLQLIKAPMRNTVMLNSIQLVIVFAIVIPLGITTAVRKGSAYDNAVQVVTILGYSLPTFIICLISILIFSSALGWLPVSGTVKAALELTGTKGEVLWSRVLHMVQPILVMVFMSLAGLTRYIRATMIDALRMDYIRTARAKGLKEKVVIYSHAFRNSLIPFVTALIAWFVSIFSGSLVVETIFSWNGMGKLFYDSMLAVDFSVVLALGMFYVMLALVGNLIMDLTYTLVDPRVRLS